MDFITKKSLPQYSSGVNMCFLYNFTYITTHNIYNLIREFKTPKRGIYISLDEVRSRIKEQKDGIPQRRMFL